MKAFAVKSVILIILAALMLAACQPTPEVTPVVNKGDDHLEEMIASSAKSPSPGVEGPALMKASMAPSNYKDTYTNVKGDVTVTIDAKVEVPDVGALPAVQVKLTGFTQEQVNKFGEYFLKGAPLFSQERVRTKAEIEESIINEEQFLKELKDIPDVRDEEIQEVEGYIEELKKQYAKAPEERKKTSATLELVSDENGTNLYVMADLGKDEDAIFAVYNHDGGSNFTFRNEGKGRYDPYSDMQQKQDSAPRGMKTTREDAEKAVMQCLSDLGIKAMQVEGVRTATYYGSDNDYNDEEYKNTAKQCYVFSLARMIGGVSVRNIEGSTPLSTDDPNVPVPEEPDYTLVRQPESLEILVDDTGVVQFDWTNPCEEVAVLSEHVTFIPFEEVVSHAKDNMFFKNYTAYGSKAEIKITSIKLGMMRIIRKDRPGDYLMVPVWDFIGNHKDIHDGGEDWLPFGDQSFVTINAIDGSFINRDWGY